jgi:hypothetical protein
MYVLLKISKRARPRQSLASETKSDGHGPFSKRKRDCPSTSVPWPIPFPCKFRERSMLISPELKA